MKTRNVYCVCLVALLSLGLSTTTEAWSRYADELLGQIYGSDIPAILDLQFATDRDGVMVAVWGEIGGGARLLYSERHLGQWAEPYRLNAEGETALNFSMIVPCRGLERFGKVPDLDERTGGGGEGFARGTDLRVQRRGAEGDGIMDGTPTWRRSSGSCAHGELIVVYETSMGQHRRQIRSEIRPDHDPYRQGWFSVRGGALEVAATSDVYPTLHEYGGRVWLTWHDEVDQVIGYAFLDDAWIGPYEYAYESPEEIPDIMALIEEEALSYSGDRTNLLPRRGF